MPGRRNEFGTRKANQESAPLRDAEIRKNPAETVGFAHRAHQPDPVARYAFEAGKPATLPHDPKRRWKVTG